MRKFLIKILLAFAVLPLSMPPSFSQVRTKPVQIIGMGMHYGGNIIYRYRVKNNGNEVIKRITLGFANEKNSGIKIGLSEVPIAPGLMMMGQWYPPTLIGRPDGWGAKLVAEAGEGGEIGLQWIEGTYFKTLWPDAPLIGEYAPIIYPNSKAILPGQTVDEFSVTVPALDSSYITGPATVDYGTSVLSISLEKGDSIPPTLTLNVNRVNQNESKGNWAIFDVQASAKDNYDPSPTLVFEPIASNQALQGGDVSIDAKQGNWKVKLKNIPGRSYQLRFTSQDASGNATVKSFDYIVSSSGK